MLKKIMLVLCITIMPAAAFAGGDSSPCATRYPIVLAHGMGTQSEILRIIDYWWNIPDALRDEGADVYISNVNGMDSTANKGVQFKANLLYFLAASGASKANIIGHSHGTIYTRYAITNLGLSSKVASHTSIGGPHRGSAVADLIMGAIPDVFEPFVGGTLDLVYTFLFGDKNGDAAQNGRDLVRSNMINVFNPNTPNVSGIYYQSWASRIKNILAGELLAATWLVMLPLEGDNDGLVSINSAKWGNFRGTLSGAWWCAGVNHLHQVDQFLGYTPGFSAPDFYVDVVSELQDKGY